MFSLFCIFFSLTADNFAVIGAIVILVALIICLMAVYCLIIKQSRTRKERKIRKKSKKLPPRSLSEQQKRDLETKKPILRNEFVRGVEERFFPARNEYAQLGTLDWKLNAFSLSNTEAQKYSSSIKEETMNR